MTLLNLDSLGEWNPQLFRELKGRLKPRNILITVAVSLLGQLLVLMSFSSQLPNPADDNPFYNRYCLSERRDFPRTFCLRDSFGVFEINWQLWWQDVFIWLSVIGIVALLVVGVYMLISDLSKEEQRGTLNFLRLTPQSSQSILIGKMLGVPILLYLVGFLALPLHFVGGLSGQIPFSMILGFYTVLGVSCLFFYSAALLFGLVGTWLGSFQAWLGSGIVLMFVLLPTDTSIANSSIVSHIVYHTPTDWIILFSPSILVTYFTETSYAKGMESLGVWGLPVGASVWSVLGLMLLNYGLWTYWAWQGIKRCFHKPSASLLSKQQSYWLTVCFEVMILGFALDSQNGGSDSKGLFENFQMVLVFNLQLFLCLIAMLSPHRQAMQDWVRYRHQKRSPRKAGVMSDLIWGEKSPALVAVVINVAIASAILLPWIMLWPASQYKIPALWALLLNMSLIIVYAAVAQLMLLMKMPQREPWAASTVGLMIVLPPIIFSFLSLEPSKNAGVWLFSAFPWAAVEYTTGISVFLAIIGQSIAVGLLSLQLTRQLNKAGESSTTALLSGRSSGAME